MKKLLICFTALCVLAAGGLWSLFAFYLTPDRVREELLKQVQSVFSGQIKIQKATLRAPTQLALEGLSLSAPDGGEVFLDLKRASASLDLWALASGQVRLAEVALDGFELGLKRDFAGRYSFEKYLVKRRAGLFGRRGAILLGAAVVAMPSDQEPEPEPALEIDRILLRKGRVQYLYGFWPVQLAGVAGALSLTRGRVEVLELRARAFDQFMVSMRGSATLTGAECALTAKLDESPLQQMVNFVPLLPGYLLYWREQIQGSLSATLDYKRREHGQEAVARVAVKELAWTSPSFLGATIQAPDATMNLSWRDQGRTTTAPTGAAAVPGIQPFEHGRRPENWPPAEPSVGKIEGDLSMSGPTVRPTALTTDIPLGNLKVAFEYLDGFARFKSYSASLGQGALTGSGYYNRPAGRPPEYELGFSLTQVPLADVGLASIVPPLFSQAVIVSAKGRFLPAAVGLGVAEVKFGASHLNLQGQLRPDGPIWVVRDASVRLGLDGAQLAGVLGVPGTVKIGGRLDGTIYPAGPLRGLHGTGRFDKTTLTIAPNRPAAEGETVRVELEGGALELSAGGLSTAEIRGRTLGGQLGLNLTVSPGVAGPPRIALTLQNVELAGLARGFGLGGAVSRGRAQLAGQMGALSFSGVITADQVAMAIPQDLKESAGKLGLAELVFDGVSARLLATLQGLEISEIDAAGPSVRVTGHVRLQAHGPPGGQLLLTPVGKATTGLPVSFGEAQTGGVRR
ncbi:MAG: AsmA family protein [Candidatus Riflebacteria bacterium]|nr:AsmA family protein [Candidatus Riflebacteria bacterium]